MYEWKVVLINNKEYLIKSDKGLNTEIAKELFGSTSNPVISSWELSDNDKNGCKNVLIHSKSISSIEYNF